MKMLSENTRPASAKAKPRLAKRISCICCPFQSASNMTQAWRRASHLLGSDSSCPLIAVLAFAVICPDHVPWWKEKCTSNGPRLRVS